MYTLEAQIDRKPRRPSRLRRALWLLLVGSAGLWCLHWIYLRWLFIRPPAAVMAELARTPQPPLLSNGSRSSVGENWSGRERGVWEYHLSGEPLPLGYAHARLASHLLLETEDYMFGEFHRYVPSRAARILIRGGVLLRYRNLLDQVPADLRTEMTGLAAGQPDFHDDFLPIFHRVLFYHALHDITQTLETSPLLGCSAFAAAGAATPNGHVIIGRNFDFEGPPIFDRDKAVLFFKPQGKLPFASVAWSGMMGAVTGVNAAGIYASVNALRSQDVGSGGMPVELLLREILQSAHTLDEAIELVKSRPVLVPDLYLLADGKAGESAVVERTPLRAVVRRSRDVLGVTNHALGTEFAGDRENDRLKRYLTSGARLNRLDELLQRLHGRIDPAVALQILRDKRGVGDRDLGLGNRNALDALIATHSVVVDATQLVLWIGVGPHELGRYVAFDLRRELLGEERPQPADLPEDPTLRSPEYRDFVEAQRALEVSQSFADQGRLDRAIEEAARAVALAPKFPDARKRLADLLQRRNQSDDRARARDHYQLFLSLSPPHLHDIEAVQALLR